MNIKIGYFILLLLCFIVLSLCLKFYLKYFHNPYTNQINIKTEFPLTRDKVKIEFGVSVNTINRLTDEDLFRNRSKYIILFDGSVKDKMPSEYGENDFLITYDNKYYLSFRHFKIGRHFEHTYNFSFNFKNDTIFFNADIIGDNPMKFVRPMINISMANKYRCNTPIDSAGNIYNMIDL